MKFGNHLYFIFFASTFLLGSCNQATTPTPTAKSAPVCTGSPNSFTGTAHANVGAWAAGNNQMSVTVNGSLCSGGGAYANQPCTSVTICSISDPTNCQTIDNILLDTGSYGLRVFSSAITIPGLVPITHGTDTLAECVHYGDNTSQWGPVKYAYVQLANEPKVGVPILVVDSTFGNPPTPCTDAQSIPDISPADSGYNGILGVGLFAEDCGSYCVTHNDSALYYTCHSDGNCSCGATASLNAQVVNPVAAIPTDNNGVNLNFPSVAASGVASLNGTLTLGIHTQANNAQGAVTVFPADGYGEFKVKFAAFSSSNMSGFIDSGSSILFIPSISSLPDCGGNTAGFFCPSSTQNLSAVNYGYTGSPSGTVNFSIANSNSLFNTGNAVFANMGGTSGNSSNAYFDWGLPFFYGKTVYVGIQGTSATGMGAGPFWAY